MALLSGEVRAERRAERLGEKDRDCEGDRKARVRAARLHVVDVRRIAGVSDPFLVCIAPLLPAPY